MPFDGTHHEVIEDLEHEVAMRLQARALKDESFEISSGVGRVVMVMGGILPRVSVRRLRGQRDRLAARRLTVSTRSSSATGFCRTH